MRGTILLPALLLMGALIGIGALAVDLGIVWTAQSQLQTAADAAALAGVKELALGGEEQAKQKAEGCAAYNTALGEPVALEPGDIALGHWLIAESELDLDSVQPNAMQVTARRAAERNSSVTTWFAQAFGVNELDVGAQATALAFKRDLVLIIDRSGSMGDGRCGRPGSPAIVPTREAAADFLRLLELSSLPDRAGLVTYALHPEAESVIVNVDEHIQQLRNTTLAIEAAPCDLEGSTNTGGAIEAAIELFDRDQTQSGPSLDPREMMIILLSDGLANVPRYWTPEIIDEIYANQQADPANPAWRYAVEAATEAADRGITMHTIALVPDDQELTSLAALEQLTEIATVAGGLCLHAPTTDDLDELFLALAQMVQVALVD